VVLDHWVRSRTRAELRVSWILVPFARPERLENVQANFQRQSHEGKKLCIVENGPAIGACKVAGFEPDLLLTSDVAHPSAARNVGLDALADFGEDTHVCCMDDDDFYGSFYQAEHLLFAARGRRSEERRVGKERRAGWATCAGATKRARPGRR